MPTKIIPLTFDELVKSQKTPLPRWERVGVRVNKTAFQVLISPPLNPLPPGEGKSDFLRDHNI